MTVRVLVVDDSATMRSLIIKLLRSDPEIQVVGEAADPLEARQGIKQLYPDVVTLDIEMPNMNGLEFLEKIMRLRPTPVIMVSTLTQEGAEANLRALELGAFDCVAKPTSSNAEGFNLLPEKVKAAAKSRCGQSVRKPNAPERVSGFVPDGRLLGIGSSTGGVEALINIISHFPENCPPTVISQHMPATFTKSFAQRLDRLCAARVTEASDGDLLTPGHIYLAPGDAHLEISRSTPRLCRLSRAERVNGHRPSVDVMFKSMVRTVGNQAVGVILTGMGRDGAEGLLELRRAGGTTIGQDEVSSVVYGMPRVAFEIGAVETQLPLSKISQKILQICNLESGSRLLRERSA
jgi:two-component system chemotaxis response regulator CheB